MFVENHFIQEVYVDFLILLIYSVCFSLQCPKQSSRLCLSINWHGWISKRIQGHKRMGHSEQKTGHRTEKK